MPENWGKIIREQPLVTLFIFLGIVLTAVGGIVLYQKNVTGSSAVEIIENTNDKKEIVIEIGGAVEKPGVYRLNTDARVNDALVMAGGLSVTADRLWVEKYINRAAVLVDGQKIYIPQTDEQSKDVSANQGGGDQTVSAPVLSHNTQLVNINTATLSELDTLPGIGQVYGGKIIEQRPYSNIEELLSKKVIPQSTYEKIKNLITVY